MALEIRRFRQRMASRGGLTGGQFALVVGPPRPIHADLACVGLGILFPGAQPGRPFSPSQLNQRLRGIGLHPAQDRSTALLALAGELPAALLSRMLGIDISVASQWQQVSAGDWTNYAADYALREPHQHQPAESYSETSNS
jgi:hypothetical protein